MAIKREKSFHNKKNHTTTLMYFEVSIEGVDGKMYDVLDIHKQQQRKIVFPIQAPVI